MRSYYASYYVLTPAGYLHEFKDQDSSNYTKDSEPEMSLFLPECSIGALSTENKFIISGKDMGSTLGRKHDFAFKCGSAEEAAKWHDALSRAAGVKTDDIPPPTPATPTVEKNAVVGAPAPAADGSTPPPYSAAGPSDAAPAAVQGPTAGTVPTSATSEKAPMQVGQQPPAQMSGAVPAEGAPAGQVPAQSAPKETV